MNWFLKIIFVLHNFFFVSLYYIFQVVNPDYSDGLVWCEDCDRYYHSDCIPDDHTTCDQCDTYLTRELYGRGSKYFKNNINFKNQYSKKKKAVD